MKINNITIRTIPESLTRDESGVPLSGMIGGTIYMIDTDNGVWNVQVENFEGTQVWYQPEWSVYSTDLLVVLEQCQEYEDSYKKESEAMAFTF